MRFLQWLMKRLWGRKRKDMATEDASPALTSSVASSSSDEEIEVSSARKQQLFMARLRTLSDRHAQDLTMTQRTPTQKKIQIQTTSCKSEQKTSNEKNKPTFTESFTTLLRNQSFPALPSSSSIIRLATPVELVHQLESLVTLVTACTVGMDQMCAETATCEEQNPSIMVLPEELTPIPLLIHVVTKQRGRGRSNKYSGKLKMFSMERNNSLLDHVKVVAQIGNDDVSMTSSISTKASL